MLFFPLYFQLPRLVAACLVPWVEDWTLMRSVDFCNCFFTFLSHQNQTGNEAVLMKWRFTIKLSYLKAGDVILCSVLCVCVVVTATASVLMCSALWMFVVFLGFLVFLHRCSQFSAKELRLKIVINSRSDSFLRYLRFGSVAK